MAVGVGGFESRLEGLVRGRRERAAHLAKTLARLPATQQAFDAGDISRAHVQAIANGYTEERAEQLAHIEADLVRLARKVDPKSLRAAVQRCSGTRTRSTVTAAPATTKRRTRRTGSTRRRSVTG